MSSILLVLIIATLVGIAAYNFICTAVDVPTGATSKMMMLSGRRRGVRQERLFDVYIARAAEYIARFIKLDAIKRSQLENALKVAKIQYTPEQYIAAAIVRAGFIILVSTPFRFLHPLMSIVGIALGCLVGFMRYQEVLDYVLKRRRRIESELPRFAAAIAQNLEIDRDILRMLINYRRAASAEFGEELDQTVADMKLGNYENALLAFEKRVNSPMLSDIVRGLIGVLRGDDQRVYFKMICFDMKQMEKNNLKKEAMKRPQAMQKYCMFMMLCILIIYGVVLVTEVTTALGVMF